MKKLIIALMLVVGISTFAQNRREMRCSSIRNKIEKMSPEQRSLLMSKKMTLELDLNVKQQEQIKTIIAEQIAKMEVLKAERIARKQSNKNLSTDAIFEMKSKRLDNQITTKKRMEKILNPNQFEKWTSIVEENRNFRQERLKNSKRGNQQCDQQCDQQGKRQRQG